MRGFALGVLISCIVQSASGQICSVAISGSVYENAPEDTKVGDITTAPSAVVGVTITLSLDTTFDKYFKLNGTDILVKSPTELDRSEFGTSGADFVNINGAVNCNTIPGGTTIETQGSIRMFYTNKEPPTYTSLTTWEQSEFTPIDSVVATLTATDGDNTGGTVTFSLETTDYFSVGPNSGELTLIQELDYEIAKEVNVTVIIEDTGVNELGNPLSKTISTILTFDVTDYDDTPPLFQPCDCTSQFYTANITVNTKGNLVDVQPGPIKATDGDTEQNIDVVYDFIGGSPGFEKYFQIDTSSGEVQVYEAIPQDGTFVMGIRAKQDNDDNKFSVAYLQVDAYTQDDSKPEISTGGADLTDTYVNDDGSEQLYVEDFTGNRIKLDATDSDGGTLIYMINPPDVFQVLSNGYIFASRSDLFGSTRATIQQNYTVTAINIDANVNSPNRVSDPVKLDITIIEMTTAATTEATTFITTEATTSVPDTTTEETTELTTLDTTTFSEPTTLQPTTDDTTISTTVASTTDETTTPEPTTTLPTVQTTFTSLATSAEITTPAPSTMPTSASNTDETTSSETTTFSTSVDTTFTSTNLPSTTPEITTLTTETSTLPSSTAFSSASTDATTIGTTGQSTTQQSSTPTPVSTVPPYTSQTSDQSVASTSLTTSIPTDQSSPEASTSATDVTPITELSSTIFDISSASTSESSVVSTTSESTGTVATNTPTPSVATSTSVETTTAQSSSTATSSSNVFSSTAPTKPLSTVAPNDVSTAGPVIVTTTESSSTKDGTSVIEEVVPKSTLIGVAAGLSSALLIAIIIIAYLLWKLLKKDKKDAEDDKRSETSSQTHTNDAYDEESETSPKESNGDLAAATVGFSATDPNTAESGVHMGDDQDSEIIEDTVTDGGYEFAGEPEQEDLVGNEYEQLVNVDDEEDQQTPSTDFERELMDRANDMAIAAAATAALAKAVEEPATPEVPAVFTPNLSPDVVTEKEVIKEDVYHSVKLVMLKGYGDDGYDVKAVLKTIDTEMSTSVDVNRVRKQISIMEELSEMDHPNILRYYGSFVTDDTINYALKYAENGNLKDMLKSGTLSSHDMMLLMANIGKGLQYLHAKNITHGNIWAKAVMLDGTNTPMLTDIEGSSKASSEFKEIMRWQAVEIVNQTSKSSPATDVWSFGTLMWEIVSQGATPYKDVPLTELSKTMENGQLEKPRGCSDSLFSIMEKCWKKDPRLRDDMYVVNSNLSELLLEDSNEHIKMNGGGGFSGNRDETPELPNQSDIESNADFTAF